MTGENQPGSVVSLDDVLITDELERRSARAPAHDMENRALGMLVHELAGRPGQVLQKLAELVLEVCQAGSAGVSILESDGREDIFRWHATAGTLANWLHTTMPRNASPCGVVIDRNEMLLFAEPHRYFPALHGVGPRVFEALLAPWSVDGRPIGTVWVLAHARDRHFDGEDARLLRNLATVAAAS